ncbi:galectin-3b isoform X2 [Megalops cyprinoides]|uniref:galectin-3b isoform X2 n=1 Tax=Megalops cyprinoides TaxID=118141 RepID=UPI001864F405|nr:galectin-3b isoform X2 [Megalops cyprinoides]
MDVNNLWPAQKGENSDGAVWPGQPNQPLWPGQQPPQPMWPGQQPMQPMWPGQQPSQPAWPAQPNRPTAPGWPGQNPPSAPQQVPSVPLTVPYDLKLPDGVYNKMLITINGEIKPNSKKFAVNLTRGNDIALHFNTRFDDCGKKTIVRNSLVGGKWGKEERELSNFPFVQGKSFEMKILCTDNEFMVAVNKSHLLAFKHRVTELNMITHLGIYDDITLSSVTVETLP